jgi:hypothetical protein
MLNKLLVTTLFMVNVSTIGVVSTMSSCSAQGLGCVRISGSSPAERKQACEDAGGVIKPGTTDICCFE